MNIFAHQPLNEPFIEQSKNRAFKNQVHANILLGIILNSALWRLFRARNKRHAYATHQLEGGLSVHKLKQLLGHNNINSTMRYIHWLPSYQGDAIPEVDLLMQLGVNHESL